jgi:predicted acetyltransferase
MNIEVIPAKIEQKSILANLLELYIYDFTEIWDFDIGETGVYGYERLPLYWEEPNRHPFLIYVDGKIAGFVLVQKGSPIADDKNVYDIAEFFILRKYRRKNIGSTVAHKVWKMFKGDWQVRVLIENMVASAFWFDAIKAFTGRVPIKQEMKINDDDWSVYRFESL